LQSFNFPLWREWLQSKADELNAQGLTVRFNSREQHLPYCGLEIEPKAVAGSFHTWENQLVDYEIYDARTMKLAKAKAMIEVTDENFEVVFDDFVASMRKVI